MKQTHIYIPIDVKERMPSVPNEMYGVIHDGLIRLAAYNGKKFYLDHPPFAYYNSEITHWLEKQDSAIVCTKEDLDNIFYKGLWWEGTTDDSPFDEFHKYLESKGIKL